MSRHGWERAFSVLHQDVRYPEQVTPSRGTQNETHIWKGATRKKGTKKCDSGVCLYLHSIHGIDFCY